MYLAAMEICSLQRQTHTLSLTLYPPIQANRTESEARHCCNVSSGKGSFFASIAAPPIRASFKSISKPQRLHKLERTSAVAEVISGPIPSPGRTVILYVSFRDTAISNGEDREDDIWLPQLINGINADPKLHDPICQTKLRITMLIGEE
jgi:hypothetical protein